MRVFLIGFMGAGKTSVGKSLASRLGYRFVDLDDWIEDKARMPVSAIFARLGETHFRRLEREQLAAVSAEDHLVVATGGGVPIQAANLAAMRGDGSLVVWLDPSFETIANRMNDAAEDARPLWASLNEARALYEERSAVYEAAADLRVTVAEDASLETVVTGVEQRLRERSCAI